MKSSQNSDSRAYLPHKALISDSETKQARAMTWAFFIALAAILFAPIFSRSSWLVFVQDDFLYYLKVAQNIASGRGSTFNGLVATNGFQPLWLCILVILSWITDNSRIIMAFLATSNLLAGLATFALSRKLLQTSGTGRILTFVFSGWITLYSTTLFFYGMEVTLTVPLMLAALVLLTRLAWIQQSWTHTLLLGLLLSAMVLSRIDTLIFGGLLLCGILTNSSLRKTIRIDLAVGLGTGLLPVVIYFLYNHAAFHTWLPISGMAKELKSNHMPSIEPWKVFFHPLAGTYALIILFASARLYLCKERFEPIERALFAATLLFPFLYYFVLSCVSDWTLWGWYMYPIRTALSVSFVIILRGRLRQFLDAPAARTVLVVSVFGCLMLLRWTRQQTDIYSASVEIEQFAQTHPGLYAMGDRAGRVGYLIPNPLIQTEGLMMDREYLGYIERETPLRDTLAHYKVRYYVATAYEPYSGCFQAIEPAKGGPTSAKMRAIFCNKPEAEYLHEGIKTMIFDLTKQ